MNDELTIRRTFQDGTVEIINHVVVLTVKDKYLYYYIFKDETRHRITLNPYETIQVY